jgi:chemotaxis protein histidine kinase CheA
MVKTRDKHETSPGRAATKAFQRAWKLLGKLERRLTAARAEEAKRRRQLAEATGPDLERRQVQLDAAVASAAKAAALLTELSELIAANARAQARQTVSDVAHEAAQAVRAEAKAQTVAGERPAARRPGRPRLVPGTSRTTRGAPRPTARPTAAGAPRPRRVPAAKPAVDGPAAATTPATPSETTPPPTPKPAARRTVRKAPAKAGARPAAQPRPRRSLQPGQPDPDPSSS